MAKLWKPKHIRSVKIALASAITITGSAALNTFFTGTTGNTNMVQAFSKTLTIAVPEGAVDKVDFLGVDTNSFQYAELEDKPFDVGGISGTLVLNDDEVLETFFYGTGTAVSTTHMRYQAGILSASGRPDIAILVDIYDPVSSKEVECVITNARITKLGDIKISGPDSHFEVEFNAVCLPRDFYLEVKN